MKNIIQQIKDRYKINGKFFNFQEDEDCINYLFNAGYTLYENSKNNDIITYCKEFDNELHIKNSYENCKKYNARLDDLKPIEE